MDKIWQKPYDIERQIIFERDMDLDLDKEWYAHRFSNLCLHSSLDQCQHNLEYNTKNLTYTLHNLGQLTE